MTNLLHLALAGFLLCIGVMAVCGSARGIRLHWWYVAVKIPAVLVAAAVSVWVWSGLMKGINAAITPPPGAGAGPQMSVTRVLMISAVVGAGVALIYPLLLTFLLTRRTVRDYVGAIRG